MTGIKNNYIEVANLILLFQLLSVLFHCKLNIFEDINLRTENL